MTRLILWAHPFPAQNRTLEEEQHGERAIEGQVQTPPGGLATRLARVRKHKGRLPLNQEPRKISGQGAASFLDSFCTQHQRLKLGNDGLEDKSRAAVATVREDTAGYGHSC